MRSWEVNDDAWEAFQKAEDMCAGIQAAYEAGIRAAGVASQPEPEYEYGWELREPDSRNLFDGGGWHPTEFDAREDGAIAKRQSKADSPELPPLTFTVIRRVKAGAWEPMPNQSNGSES